MLGKASPHKHRALADRLRTLADSLVPGDRMPSVPDLARQFGVAASTVQVAVETLRREGRIVSRRGSGTFVAELPISTGKKTLVLLALYSNPFFQHVVTQITDEACRRGRSVTCRYDDHQMTPVDTLRLEALDPAGFFVVGTELNAHARALAARGHRVVLFGEPLVGETAGVCSVYADSEQGGYLATRRLLDLGHRRLFYAHCFASDADLFAWRRWQGHVRALQEAGLDASTHPVLGQPRPGCWDEAALYAVFAHRQSAPTGVIAWNDLDGARLLPLLARMGLRVPGDVSLVGYDDLPAGRQTDPPLDTVDQHFDVQIRHAFSLLSVVPPEAGAAPPSAVVAPTLRPRASCAALVASA